jgi:GlpG protein
MTMVKVCTFAPGQNLDPLLQRLDGQGLAYQLREGGAGAELWVEDGQLEQVSRELDQLRAPVPRAGPPFWAAVARTWPLTLVTMVLGICGFLVTSLAPQWIGWFTFTAVEMFISYDEFHSFSQTYWVDHQWWRLITPAFLHFGLWHLLFNTMALWELGRRLEFLLPRGWYCAILLVTGVAANAVQYWLSGPSIFGGLSGVIFGLFGVIAVLYRRTGSPLLRLPVGFYVLAAVSLIALPLVLQRLFEVHVANGAHVGGLVAGLVLALMIPYSAVRQVELPPRAPR